MADIFAIKHCCQALGNELASLEGLLTVLSVDGRSFLGLRGQCIEFEGEKYIYTRVDYCPFCGTKIEQATP